MNEKMQSNNMLNIEMSIKFFEDLVIMLKELKEFREKELNNFDEKNKKKQVKM